MSTEEQQPLPWGKVMPVINHTGYATADLEAIVFYALCMYADPGEARGRWSLRETPDWLKAAQHLVRQVDLSYGSWEFREWKPSKIVSMSSISSSSAEDPCLVKLARTGASKVIHVCPPSRKYVNALASPIEQVRWMKGVSPNILVRQIEQRIFNAAISNDWWYRKEVSRKYSSMPSLSSDAARSYDRRSWLEDVSDVKVLPLPGLRWTGHKHHDPALANRRLSAMAEYCSAYISKVRRETELSRSRSRYEESKTAFREAQNQMESARWKAYRATQAWRDQVRAGFPGVDAEDQEVSDE